MVITYVTYQKIELSTRCRCKRFMEECSGGGDTCAIPGSSVTPGKPHTTIRLPHYQPAVFRVVLTYIYTGKVSPPNTQYCYCNLWTLFSYIFKCTFLSKVIILFKSSKKRVNTKVCVCSQNTLNSSTVLFHIDFNNIYCVSGTDGRPRCVRSVRSSSWLRLRRALPALSGPPHCQHNTAHCLHVPNSSTQHAPQNRRFVN